MEKKEKKQLTINNKLKIRFISAINLYQKFPIPNTGLISDILTIIYTSNGEPDTICMEILSRGLIETKSSIRKYLSFMKRINLLKDSKKIEITNKYLPK